MSSVKRKRQIIVSSDEECDPPKRDSDEEKKRPKETKRKKKIVLSESDSEENADISINSIKKNAAKRAKNLAQGIDSLDGSSSKKAKQSKTPPSAGKASILNYFKPVTKDSPKKEKKEIKVEPQSDSKTITGISDDFEFTCVKEKAKDRVEPTRKEIKSESPSKGDTKIGFKVSRENSPIEKPKEKVKESISKNSNQLKESAIKPKSDSKVFKEVNGKVVSKNEPKSENDVSGKKKAAKSPKKPFVLGECLPRIVETKKESDLWVDRYKPSRPSQVIGNPGVVSKLTNWLRNWHNNLDKKPSFGKWGSDDGGGFRATLLSGPPGIGKTTTAQLICKDLGFDYLELNASDTRSKKSIQGEIRELLGNTKLTDFFKSESKNKEEKLTSKHCVIMDEVDGMAGNEDRGGVAELIQLIKNTKVPIICICNNRNDKKMRSLVNYCYDLRYQKPTLQAVKGLLMSIAFKEKVKISPEVLNDLVISSNFDIRQCIHNLSLLSATTTTGGHNVQNNQSSERPIKDIKLGPFEAIKKVFATGEQYARMSFADKSDLFFADYSIMPLFVYENYIQVDLSSKCSSVAKQLKRLSKSIDSISFSDMIEKEVRTNQNWSLLPLQAAFSTVMPSSYMRSTKGLGFPAFPQYMGKLSTYNKNCRLVDELNSHMVLEAHGTRSALALDYLEPLRNQFVQPLLGADKGGVPVILDLMEKYSLIKDDMDSIIELNMWSNETHPLKNVDSKTKAALTRAYNKKDFALPYAVENDTKVITKKGKAAAKNSKKSSKVEAEEESLDESEPDIPDELY